MRHITLIFSPEASPRTLMCPFCGNTDRGKGFSECNGKGEVVDGVDEQWDERHLGCNHCETLLEVIYARN